jgi:hypothetical protein
MKGRYLVVVAFAVFLIFVGESGYQFLCPPSWFVVECVVIDSSGKSTSSKVNSRVEEAAKKLAAGYEKLGRTCKVLPLPIRECPWDHP